MHWYSRDPDAALAGMAELTLEECGAYNIIIDLSYARDGNVPDDDQFICRHLHCRPQTWRRIKASLERHGKLTVNQGQIEAKRVLNELERARKRMVKNLVYNEKRNKNNLPPSTERPIYDQTTTSTSTTKKKEKKDSLSAVNGHEVGFMKVWEVYPRKQKQGAARVEFYKAIKIVSVETMIAAIERAKPGWESNDPKYIPQLVNWLKDRRWLDELPMQPPPSKFKIPR